jgi:hypothetical protein
MDDRQLQTYRQIQQYSLDNSDAEFPFSKKLAKENNWTVEYTKRAIEEYKKFTFLAVVSGHPVSPSETVDRVWHLHLTYTQDYWEEFCLKILGKSLHHQPSYGGCQEQEKYSDWYIQTINSYQLLFGEIAPIDIWESPETRFRLEDKLVRVDREKNWIIPKLKFIFFRSFVKKYFGIFSVFAFFSIAYFALFFDSLLHTAMADTITSNSHSYSSDPNLSLIVFLVIIMGLFCLIVGFCQYEKDRQNSNRRHSSGGDSSSSSFGCTSSSSDCDGGSSSSGGDCGCGSGCGGGCGGGCGS